MAREDDDVTVRPLNTWTVSPGELGLTLDDVSVCVAVNVCEPLLRLLVPPVVTVIVEAPLATVPVAIAVVPPSA